MRTTPPRPHCPFALLFTALALFAASVVCSRGGTITNVWSGAGGDGAWATAANWDNGLPGFTSTVFFTQINPAVDQFTSNNTVGADTTIDSLFYRSTNVIQTTYIPDAVTLAVTGQVAWTYALVNVTNSFFCGPYPDQAASASAAIIGQGTLLISNRFARMSIRNANSANPASLNLSNLNTFVATVDRLMVGGEGNNAPANRPTGYLRLAKTNFITSFSTVGSGATAGLTIGEAAVNSGGLSIVTMGYTNVIFADSGITVGGARNIGRLEFGVPGVAYFRDRSGTGRQGQWGIGDNNTGSTGTGCTGTADFTGGTVDAMVNILYVGRGEAANNAGVGNGTMLLSNGIINVNDLRIGYMRTAGGSANGTVTTSGGTGLTNLIVNNNLVLGMDIGAGNAAGTLNIGSAISVTGSVVDGGGTGSSVSLNGGVLTVGGKLGNNGGVNDQPLGALNLNSGTLNLSLGTAGNPIIPVCNVQTLSVGSVTLNLTGSGLTPGTVPVMKYYTSGTFAGISPNSMPPKVSGYFTNSIDTLFLVITNVDSPKWQGNVSGNWDINTTTNWVSGSTGSPVAYQQFAVPGDAVLFDDSATGSTAVNLTTVLSPLSMTVNNTAKTYSFGGTGGLSGPGSLAKQGDGLMALTNSGVNDFAGTVTVGGGTLQLGAADNRLPTNAIVNLADAAGASIDLNGFNQQLSSIYGGGDNGGNVSLGGGTLTMGGSGLTLAGVISGSGGLFKTGGGNQILSGANTYSGGTVITNGTLTVINASGSGIGSGNLLIAGGTLQVGNGDTAGSIPQTLITNNGTLLLNRSDDQIMDKVLVGSGGLTKSGPNVVLLVASNSCTGPTTINDGSLRLTNANFLPANGRIVIGSGGPARLELSNNVVLSQTFQLSSKAGALNAPPHFENLDGTNTLAGPITAGTGGTDWSFQSDNGLLIVSGSFSNVAGGVSTLVLDLRGVATGEWRSSLADGSQANFTSLLTKRDLGTWTITTASTNTYTGATAILANGGTLIVNGAIMKSSGLSVGINSTLAGSGYIGCGVTNGALSFLAPGNNSVGTLTVSNWLNLSPSATCVFEVGDNRCDQVRGLTGVTLGGTLQVSVVGTIYGVESFKLFDAQSYLGGFGGLDLPTLPSPLAWDTTDLNTLGILRVTGGIYIATNSIVGGNMTIAGIGPAGNPYRVLASTNLLLPLNLWTEAGSGILGGDGSFSFTDTNTHSFSQRFYRMVTP